MSAHAKTVAASFAAVLITAITAWQSLGGGLRLVDLLPVAVIVLGAVQTHVIPNVPELPWAKSVVAGSSSILAAVATYVAADPSGYTAAKLLTVASGAFLVWFVPELEGAIEPTGLASIAGLHEAVAALADARPTATVVAEIPRHSADLTMTQPISITPTINPAESVPTA